MFFPSRIFIIIYYNYLLIILFCIFTTLFSCYYPLGKAGMREITMRDAVNYYLEASGANRFDLDIRNKTNRSLALDDAIDAKKQEVAGLEAKADKKLRDFYTIKERGDWQDPLFFAMSAYIYRIDEGLQFCI